jgi:hypothetical protein
MDNAFEKINRVRCFNHTLQLSAKTLLKPFNTGRSSAHMAADEEESHVFDNEVPMPSDAGDDSDDDDDSDDIGSGEEDLGDAVDEPEDEVGDGIDELNGLDEEEREKILADTAVVRQTVNKVRMNSFWLLHCLSLIAGPAIIVCYHSLDNYCTPGLAGHLHARRIQAASHPSRCCHPVELNI